ncbi:MAG: hypothetical protein ACYCZF_06120 [Anaerolineae bacterium]
MLDSLLTERPNEFTVVAIDIDVNEDADLLRSRAKDYQGSSVLWVISPKELTDALVTEFGPDVITPPTAPIIVISSDQTRAWLMPRGKKSAADLSAALEEANKV